MTGNSWLMLIACVGLGAIVEPKITPYLIQAGGAGLVKSGQVVKPELEDPALDFDLSMAKPEDFPKYFKLKQDWVVSTKEGSLMDVEAGSEWQYDHHHGETVYFTGLQGTSGDIHIGHTDIVEILEDIVAGRKVEEEAHKNAEAASVANNQTKETSAKETVPMKKVVKDPSPGALSTAKNEPHRAISRDQLLSLMKSSVGDLSEFKAAQVVSWEPGEDSVPYQGQDVQTGNIVYSADTLFGKKDIQARAIIRNGKIVKWIWPTSGLEIR